MLLLAVGKASIDWQLPSFASAVAVEPLAIFSHAADLQPQPALEPTS
jgi:hypothetical protein